MPEPTAPVKGKRAQVPPFLWRRWVNARAALDRETARRRDRARALEVMIRGEIGDAELIEVAGRIVGRHIVADQEVAAHTRHRDYIGRVDASEGNTST